jgi:hypothetical protein
MYMYQLECLHPVQKMLPEWAANLYPHSFGGGRNSLSSYEDSGTLQIAEDAVQCIADFLTKYLKGACPAVVE